MKGHIKLASSEKRQIRMRSPLVYKSPVPSWQSCFVALEGLFRASESNSVEGLIFYHFLSYMLSASSYLHPGNYEEGDLWLLSG